MAADDVNGDDALTDHRPRLIDELDPTVTFGP
jgi:hypothetical protein